MTDEPYETGAEPPLTAAGDTMWWPEIEPPMDAIPGQAASTRRRLWTYLPWAVPVLGLLMILLTADDYGISWDEPVQSTYGELALAYFRSGGSDTRCLEYLNLYYYGPAFEMVCAFAYESLPEAKWLIRHLLTGLVGLTGVVAVVWGGRAWKLAGVGGFAGLALLLHPRWFGHLLINSKDIPFAAAFAIAMVLVITSAGSGSVSWRRSIGIGLAIGLTLSIRFGGILLLPFAGVIFGYALLRALFLGQRYSKRQIAIAAAKVAVALAVAWALMFAFWPWAHQHPISGPLEAFRNASAVPSPKTLLFAGREVVNTDMPREYLIHMLVVVTPLPILLLAAWGVVVALRRLLWQPLGTHAVADLGLMLWLIFPFAYAFATRLSVYDGLRHFLFVLPALALLAGRGAAQLLALANRQERLAVGIGLTMLLGLGFLPIVAHHPYAYTWYNATAGTTDRAQSDYETDYWATSYREAFVWINAEAARDPDRILVVAIAANTHTTTIARTYAAPNIQLVPVWSLLPSAREFDYYVAISRYRMMRAYPYLPVVHRVERMGFVYCTIQRGERPPITRPAGNR